MSKRLKNMYSTVDKLKASVLVVAMVLFMACSHSLWDDLPQPISMFITTYYPNSSISSFDETDNGYKVVVKSGPTMYFDSDYKWTEVNGNGVPLPSILFTTSCHGYMIFCWSVTRLPVCLRWKIIREALYLRWPTGHGNI